MNTVPTPRIQPNSWLTELARTKPAKWQWNRAIRAAISIGLPLGLGIITGQMAIGVWMSIASLMMTAGENNGSYRSRIKAISICSSFGALGCLIGYIGVLPWVWVVLIMALLAVAAGIISSYGAPFSLGMLQFLAVGSVALGRPQIAPFWEPMLYFLAGTAFYCLLIGLEALILRSQPRRQMAIDLLQSLAKLAQSRAENLERNTDTGTDQIEEIRRAVTTQQATLYADILGRRARRSGRTSENDSLWALLQSSDDVFAQILSTNSAKSLHTAAQDLEKIAAAFASGKKFPKELSVPEKGDEADPLERAIRSAACVRQWSHSPFSPIAAPVGADGSAHKVSKVSLLLDRLLPGRQTLRASLALALCIAMSYAAHWFDKDARWYWVPLTVAIIMKPDFGSIFARSLMRTIGTLIGAVVGTLILIFFPKGLVLVAIIALLAATMPWAAQRSYIFLGIIITPLVLVLVDLTVPGTLNVNYGGQRLLGTSIGAGIVLLFGYFIWPRTHAREISASYEQANRAICAYLLAAAGLGNGANDSNAVLPAQVAKLRRGAYARLTDLRIQLQKSMAEPAPAGTEAYAWLPIVASAERICDSITAYSVHSAQPLQPQACSAIKQLAEAIASAPSDFSTSNIPDTAKLPDAVRELLHGTSDELRFIRRATQNQPPEQSPENTGSAALEKIA